MMKPSLRHCGLHQRVALYFAILTLGIVTPCCVKLPLQANLDTAEARLDAVEARLHSKLPPGPTAQDFWELGWARYQVWRLHLDRADRGRYTPRERRKARRETQLADRLMPKMIDAFERAMEQESQPAIAAAAKHYLARIYSETSNWDKQASMLRRILEGDDDFDWFKLAAMLRRILKEDADFDDGRRFNRYGTLHSYCYHALAETYKRQGERAKAIDALARLQLASEAREKTGAKSYYRPGHALGLLLDYEPRVVLPRYARMLPADMKETLDRHRANAPTRITLDVVRATPSEIVVVYRVVFPEYPGIIKGWEKYMEGIEMSRMKPRAIYPKPAFQLIFRALPASDDLELSDSASIDFAEHLRSPILTFDEDAPSTGEITLKWSDIAKPRSQQQDVYLTAKLEKVRRGRWWRPVQESYVKPVLVSITAP